MSLFDTGIRPAIDDYLTKKAAERRDYGKYWSASSAGYCMRLNILKRLEVPPVPEIAGDAMRTQRVFEAGHIFHEWAQRITRDAGLSIAQELELQDEDLLVRGHIDDFVLITPQFDDQGGYDAEWARGPEQQLILYDYKTANSQSFNYKRDEMGHYHKMQLGTYLNGLFRISGGNKSTKAFERDENGDYTVDVTGKIKDSLTAGLSEARILTLSKDDLRMREQQIFWSPQLEQEIVGYWKTLQTHWDNKTLPPCTCLEHDGGFMGRRSKKGKVYNPYFHNDVPCSTAWASQFEKVKEFIK